MNQKMDERLLRPNWTALKQAEREALLRQIGERYQMQLEEFAHFSRWGESKRQCSICMK